MSLHHRNGDRLEEPREWVLEQLDLMRAWEIHHWDSGLSEDQRIHTWITLFAKWARDICNDHNIDVETFGERFLQFENHMLPALMVFVWQVRDAVGRHVSLEEVLPYVRGVLHEVLRAHEKRHVRFSMHIPFDGSDGQTEFVEFPVEGSCEETSVPVAYPYGAA